MTLQSASTDFEPVLRVSVRRALTSGDAAKLPLHFEASVLDRYRGMAGFSLIRTNTVGRVKKEGGWAIAFGIAPDESLIHVCIGDLLALPDEERVHWSEFAAALPSSRMFLQMRLAPGACYDDGEVRKWE
jgi:hypothetical protein